MHIRAGHKVLTQEAGRVPFLLTTDKGKGFNNVTFVQYWEKLMRSVDTMGQSYFPPSAGRTMYVEQITS